MRFGPCQHHFHFQKLSVHDYLLSVQEVYILGHFSHKVSFHRAAYMDCGLTETVSIIKILKLVGSKGLMFDTRLLVRSLVSTGP